MKTWRVAFAILIIPSCAGPEVAPPKPSPRFSRLIPSPDEVGRVLFQRIQEMHGRKSNPPEIVQLCDDYLRQYPFTFGDLPLDADKLESVADARSLAWQQIHDPNNDSPRFNECRKTEKISDFDLVIKVLESDDSPGHEEDGGRCARHLYRVFKEGLSDDGERLVTTTRYKQWYADGEIPHEDAVWWVLSNYVSALPDPEGSIYLLLACLRASKVLGKLGFSRTNSMYLADCATRPADRLLKLQNAWEDAQTYPSESKTWLGEAAEVLALHPLSAEFRRLGESLKFLQSRYSDFIDSDCTGGEFGTAVEGVLKWGKETPFPEAARFLLIEAHIEMGNLKGAEKLYRNYSSKGRIPKFGSQSLYLIAEGHDYEERSEQAGVLLKEALRGYPDGEAAAAAEALLAVYHLKAGRVDEALFLAESILRRPTWPQHQAEQFETGWARDTAGCILAECLERKSQWRSAISAWRSWEPRTSCGNLWAGIEARRSYGIAWCEENRGRVDEAMKGYWDLVSGGSGPDKEAAARLKSLSERLGRVEEVKRQVHKRVRLIFKRRDLKKNPSPLAPYDGLRWLNQQLFGG